MTSDLRWMEFKGEIDNQLKKTVVKKDSYSSDSLDEHCEDSLLDIRKNETSSDEDLEMNKDKFISCSDISSANDSCSITSHYCFEIVEETEALQTEDIKESIDIRISPRNSTVMSVNCSSNFYSDFSLVANVEVQNPNMNGSLENHIRDSNEVHRNNQKCDTNNVPEFSELDLNGDKDINIVNGNEWNESESHGLNLHCKTQKIDLVIDSTSSRKSEFSINKVNMIKCEKKMESSIEKKIAEEIKELKKREEDLRAMRKMLAKEMNEKSSNKSINQEATVVAKTEKSTSEGQICDEKPMLKTNTTSKVENAYVKACVFAVKRKNISEKLVNSEMINKTLSAITHQESPVEREIRIAKEREEELKREREQALKSKSEMDSLHSEFGSAETDADSALSICSDSSFDSVSKLAPLFQKGDQRALSPESVINNSNGISLYSSSIGSLGSLESLSHPRQNAGSHATGGSFLSPSPDSSSYKPGFPFTSPRVGADLRSKIIDMERFITSKGKEIKFKGDLGNIGYSTYYEMKPPQVKKGEVCKRFVTAATKIQNELKEMEEREEQLKKERARLQQDVGNQPNTVKSEELPLQNDDSQSSKTEPSLNKNDISEENHLEQNGKQETFSNHGRRRSALIEEWELRIQKSITQP